MIPHRSPQAGPGCAVGRMDYVITNNFRSGPGEFPGDGSDSWASADTTAFDSMFACADMVMIAPDRRAPRIIDVHDDDVPPVD